MGIPALPFCQTILKAPRPLPSAYPRELKTLGDHLKKKRLDSKILQRKVAQVLGADETSICNWENNRTSPALRVIPCIIDSLGYSLADDMSDRSLGDRILGYRRMHGVSQKELARQLGVDAGALSRWEKGRYVPAERFLEALKLCSTSLSTNATGLGEEARQ